MWRQEHEGVRVVYATGLIEALYVAPDQYASAHRVGKRVMAAAHVLHYGVGVRYGRSPLCSER